MMVVVVRRGACEDIIVIVLLIVVGWCLDIYIVWWIIQSRKRQLISILTADEGI